MINFLENAAKLAQVYEECIKEMNTNIGIKSTLNNVRNLYKKDVRNVNS